MALRRASILKAVDVKDWPKAYAEIYAYNSIFTEEYRLHFSTTKYNEIMSEKSYIVCHLCKERVIESEIDKYKIPLDKIESKIRFGKLYVLCFKCPNCLKRVRVEKCGLVHQKPKTPTFTGFIPEAPNLNPISISGDKQCLAWVMIAVGELENASSRYRHDYESRDSAIGEELPDDGEKNGG